MARKFTKAEREAVIERAHSLDCQEVGQAAIACELGVSQGQVSEYLKTWEERHRQEQEKQQSTDRWTAWLIVRYREVIRECWAAWQRSKEDIQEHTEEFKLPPEPQSGKGKDKRTKAKATLKKIKEVLHREGRLPAVAYLQIILTCYEAIRKLLGLDQEPDKGINVNQNTLIFAMGRMEERVKEVEQLPTDAEVLEAEFAGMKRLAGVNGDALGAETPR